ncbi:MAG: nitroreductase family protein [Thermodesulfobacteriota bacterium]
MLESLTRLMAQTRTCRRFDEATPLSLETLRRLIDLARLGGSAKNLQPLRYMLVSEPALAARVFPLLGWAGYLHDWPGPPEGERPPAYIVCLLDTRLSRDGQCDLGIASQNILLGATALGLGGCRIASFSSRLREVLLVPPHFDLLLVIALGLPRETVRLEPLGPDGDLRYWRDAEGVHHVPKRALDDLLIPPPKG